MTNAKSQQLQQNKDEVYHSYKFFIRKQEDGESFESFFTDIFKLGKECHFKNYEKVSLEKLIRDKIVFGLNDAKTREEIFCKGYTELCDIINYCRASERKKPRGNRLINVSTDGNGIKETEKVRNGSSKSSDDAQVCSDGSPPDASVKHHENLKNERRKALEKGKRHFDSDNASTSKNIESERDESELSSCNIKESHPKIVVDSDASDNENSSSDDSDKDNDYNPKERERSESENEEYEIMSTESSGSRSSSVSSSDDGYTATNIKKAPQRRNKTDVSLLQSREFHKCDKCGERFSQRFKLKKHISTCRKKFNDEDKRSNKIFRCTTCPQTFTSQKDLDLHELIHPYKTTYKCDECGKAFYDHSGLDRHIVKNHKSHYQCDYCRKEFYIKSKFNSHLAYCHESRKRP